MSLRFKQEHKNVYFDETSSLTVEPNVKYRLILSPHLYWVQKLELPLKNAREVKKVAHTLFEEKIPDNIDYSYYVYKQNDEFFVFAYDDKKILKMITEKGISLSAIASVHFAQSELDSLEGTYAVNDTEAIQVKDGIVILLPRSWFGSLQELSVDDIKVSDKNIKLQQFNSFIDSKILYQAMAVMVFFIIVLTLELWIVKKDKENITQAREKIFSQYGLKPTLMQNRSILQHYETIYEKQKALREYIILLLKSSLKKDQKIQSISYVNGKVKAVVTNVKPQEVKRITALFIQKKIAHKVDFKKDNMQLEITL